MSKKVSGSFLIIDDGRLQTYKEGRHVSASLSYWLFILAAWLLLFFKWTSWFTCPLIDLALINYVCYTTSSFYPIYYCSLSCFL